MLTSTFHAQQIEVEYTENVIIKDLDSFNKLDVFDKIRYSPDLFKFKLVYVDGFSSYVNNDFSKIYDQVDNQNSTKSLIEFEDGEVITFVGKNVIDPNAYKSFEKKFYKDYINKKIYAEVFTTELKQIEDVFFDWNWQITNEEKNIAGFKCKKAISNIKGYHFEAWFTDEIPIAVGPDQFDGLPGLILYVNTGYLEIIAKNIKFLKNSKIIEMPIFKENIYTFNELYSKKDFKPKDFKPIFQTNNGTKNIKNMTPVNN